MQHASVYLHNNPTIGVKFKKTAKEQSVAEKLIKERYDEHIVQQKQFDVLIKDSSLPIQKEKQKSKYQVMPNKIVVTDQQTLDILTQRLGLMIEDFNEKAALGNTSKDDMEKLTLQITITRSMIAERKRVIKRTTLRINSETKNTNETGNRSDSNSKNKADQSKIKGARSNNKSFATSIFTQDIQQMKALQFQSQHHDKEKEIVIENSEDDSDEAKKAKANDFETHINDASKYKMEVDLEFRAKFMREQEMSMFEVLEALDQSSVEDLISYKLRDDKEMNLFTLDDLRYRQILVAKELEFLRDTSNKRSKDYTVPQMSVQDYEQMLKKPKLIGQFSAHVTGRTMEATMQQDVNKKLGSYASRMKVPMAIKNRFTKTLNLEMENKQNSFLIPPIKERGETASSKGSNENKSLRSPAKMNLSPKKNAQSINNSRSGSARSPVKPVNKTKETLSKALKMKLQQLQAAEKENMNQTTTSNRSPKKLSPTKLSPSKKNSQQIKLQSFINDVATFGMVPNKLPKSNRMQQIGFRDPLKEKFAKGYMRDVKFNQNMSLPVLNFGLKLYNTQTLSELLQLFEKEKMLYKPGRESNMTIGSGDHSPDFTSQTSFNQEQQNYEVGGIFRRDKSKLEYELKEKSIWEKKKQKIEINKLVNLAVDERFEHTELELLRKLFGDDIVFNEILAAVKQEKIQKKVDDQKEKIERQNAAYAYSVQTKPKPVTNFEFLSTDFLPDGTFRLGGQSKKSEGAKSFMTKLQEGFKKLIQRKGSSPTRRGAGKNNFGKNGDDASLRQSIRSKISTQKGSDMDEEVNEFIGIGKTFAGVFPALKKIMTRLDEKDKDTIEVKDLNLIANDDRSRNDAKLIGNSQQMLRSLIQTNSADDDDLKVNNNAVYGRGKKHRGLDFVRLNKRVVYPSIFKFTTNLTNSQENSPVQKHRCEFHKPVKPLHVSSEFADIYLNTIPLSVRNIDHKNDLMREKIMQSVNSIDLGNQRKFLSPGEQDKDLSLIQSIQVLQSARSKLRQFNSVDEQLKARLAQTIDPNFDEHDPIDDLLKKKKRPIVNQKILTKVYVQGKRYNSKDYVPTLPYAQNSYIKVLNPSDTLDCNQNKLIGEIELYQTDHIARQKVAKSLNRGQSVQQISMLSRPESGVVLPLHKINSSTIKPLTKAFNRDKSHSMIIENSNKKILSLDKSLNLHFKRTNSIKNAQQPTLQQAAQEVEGLPLTVSPLEPPEEVDPDEYLTAFELKKNNEKLRAEVEEQVRIFEQYLRVAMLQTEADHFKQLLQDGQRRLNNDSTSQMGFGVSFKFEQTSERQEEISDPTLAFTIARLNNDGIVSSSRNIIDQGSFSSKNRNPVPLELSQESELENLTAKKSLVDKFTFENVSQAKKPAKISKQLWKQITSVKRLDQYSGTNTPIFYSRKGSDACFETVAAKINVEDQKIADPDKLLLNIKKNQSETVLFAQTSKKVEQQQKSALLDGSSSGRMFMKQSKSSQNILELPSSEESSPSRGSLVGIEIPELFTENPFGKKKNSRIKGKYNTIIEEDFAREIASADVTGGFRKLKKQEKPSLEQQQASKLNYFIGPTDDSVLNTALEGNATGQSENGSNLWQQIPNHRRGLNELDKGSIAYFEKQFACDLALKGGIPFARLDAKPEAVRDNLKNLIAHPFQVGKKGDKPYVEIDPARKQLFAFERFSSQPERSKELKRLLKKTMTSQNLHAVHVEWIERIQEQWDKLDNDHRYQQSLKVSDKIKVNQVRVEKLKEENQYESKICKTKFKQVAKNYKKILSKLSKAEMKAAKRKLQQNEEQLEQLELAVREGQNKQAEMSEWNLQNEICRHKMDIRLHEGIIFEAQKLHLKSDVRMDRELEELRVKGQAITEDIFEFLKERDKYKWRDWEENGDSRILKILRANMMKLRTGLTEDDTADTSLDELDSLIMELINEINHIEDKLEAADLDQRQDNEINKICSMITSQAFKNTGWMYKYVKKSNIDDFTRSSRRESTFEAKKSTFTSQILSPFSSTKKFTSNQKPSPFFIIEATDDVTNTGKRADPKNPAGPISGPSNVSLTDNLNSETVEFTLRSSHSPKKKDVIGDDNRYIDDHNRNIFMSALEQAVHDKRQKQTQYQRMHERHNSSQGSGKSTPSINEADPSESNKSQPRKSKWLEVIAIEEKQRNLKKSSMTVANSVVEEEESSDENVLVLLDTDAAIKQFDQQLQNIKNTVSAEQNILNGWNKQDKADETKINLDLMKKTQNI